MIAPPARNRSTNSSSLNTFRGPRFTQSWYRSASLYRRFSHRRCIGRHRRDACATIPHPKRLWPPFPTPNRQVIFRGGGQPQLLITSSRSSTFTAPLPSRSAAQPVHAPQLLITSTRSSTLTVPLPSTSPGPDVSGVHS